MKTSSNGHSRIEWVGASDGMGNLSNLVPEPRVGNMEIISNNYVSEGELFED